MLLPLLVLLVLLLGLRLFGDARKLGFVVCLGEVSILIFWGRLNFRTEEEEEEKEGRRKIGETE